MQTVKAIQLNTHLNSQPYQASGSGLGFQKKPSFSSLPDQVVKSLGPATQRVYKMMAPLHASRGVELLVLDIGGFATLRTLMDLFRQKFYKKTINEKRELNLPAARERLLMEVMGTLPDGVGLLGLAAGMAAERKRNAFSNNFMDPNTLKLFNGLLKQPEINNSKQFAQALAKSISPNKALLAEIQPLVLKALHSADAVEHSAMTIAKKLGLGAMDKAIGNSSYALDGLLADANTLVQAGIKQTKSSQLFSKAAQGLINQTRGINAWRIPLALGIGAVYNFASPYFIQKLTKKVEGINDYPGEMGLRQLQKVDKRTHVKGRGLLPYLKESLANGNPIPLMISLMPLPIILGMVDTEKWSTHGIKAAFNNPLKSGFFNRALRMFQFGKSFPFAGAQQMAALYALVVFSRVASARNGVEFRERTVDAFLGWGIWILGNPLIKKTLSAFYDKTQGTQLLKKVNGVFVPKTQAEIVSLIKNPAIMRNTLSKNVWIGFGSMIATMGLLGIVEPWLSIKLTEWQSKLIYGNHTQPMPKFSKANV